MRFVGVDLGWRMDPPREDGTGICVMDERGLIVHAATVTEDREVLKWVEGGPAWVGIDASLKVPNESGLRGCEKELRAMGIKVLPTSRSFLQRRFGGSRGEALVEKLARMGYCLAEGGESDGRLIFETFPHGTLHLLSGGRRPNYKKGSRSSREDGRQEVVRLITEWEPGVEAPFEWMKGKGEKAAEDMLDAWVCVACVYSHWLNAGRTTRFVGERCDGRILLGCQQHEG